MPKHPIQIKISYRINDKLMDLVVHAFYNTQKDVEIQSISEYPSGKELTLNNKQEADIAFICMEALSEHLASESEYLFDMVYPR